MKSVDVNGIKVDAPSLTYLLSHPRAKCSQYVIAQLRARGYDSKAITFIFSLWPDDLDEAADIENEELTYLDHPAYQPQH